MKCTEAAVLASGPSLTAEDCELVRQWRDQKPGRIVIVTNTTFRAAPWADALYAMDRKWWQVYGNEARDNFPGKKMSATDVRHGVERVRVLHGGNSGGCAILYAAQCGAKRILLLGFDGRPPLDSKGLPIAELAHWHGAHPKDKGLGNCGSWKSWPVRMAKMMRRIPGVAVVNCSRSTAFTLWPRVQLELALSETKAA